MKDANEARKVVFDKNNQIGKYFNQVQELNKQVEKIGRFKMVVTHVI